MVNKFFEGDVMKKKKEENAVVKPSGKESVASSSPVVKKTYSWRLLMMGLSGITMLCGVGMFVIYFLTQNMVIGAPSVFMMFIGFFVFKFYWGRTQEVVTMYIGEVKKEQVNCMNIYTDRIVFEDMPNPEGYPWECLDDKKSYFVNIWGTAWGGTLKQFIPFTLPDTQYCDPVVFAERVLSLPAHRKIFERKETFLHKMKTAALVLAIGIVWLLIVTTGSGG